MTEPTAGQELYAECYQLCMKNQHIDAVRLSLGDYAANSLSHVPHHCLGSLVEYLLLGRCLGSFLTAVVENDLVGAFRNADDINRNSLHGYCQALYCAFPSSPVRVYGSLEIRQAWQKMGGLCGYTH